tara:strand:- start:599 stop:985 length:387 start_codon:yes stop_codon:yes gene_type:complete
MEEIKENLKNIIQGFENDVFDDKEIDNKLFFKIKRECLKYEFMDLITIMEILESMVEKKHNELINRKLNILTVWSTIFLPLSFYTGIWGMNFDDIPLVTDDHGFWVFMVLTFSTIGGMWYYFKKNKWI